MNTYEPLSSDCYYHIYNRGINSTKLFKETTNFEYFLKLYNKYIEDIADTYAWCLMGNHFHFLVRIRKTNLSGFKDLTGLDNSRSPHQYFSNMFNAYTKAFNNKYSRHGSLFERPFKRKKIRTFNKLKQLIIYINNNPVKHGICSHPIEYPWSSYLLFETNNFVKIKTEEIITWFGDIENYKECHNNLSGFKT